MVGAHWCNIEISSDKINKRFASSLKEYQIDRVIAEYIVGFDYSARWKISFWQDTRTPAYFSIGTVPGCCGAGIIYNGYAETISFSTFMIEVMEWCARTLKLASLYVIDRNNQFIYKDFVNRNREPRQGWERLFVERNPRSGNTLRHYIGNVRFFTTRLEEWQ
jgi:hypothetical protein